VHRDGEWRRSREPRDLHQLAQRRLQGRGGELVSGSGALGEQCCWRCRGAAQRRHRRTAGARGAGGKARRLGPAGDRLRRGLQLREEARARHPARVLSWASQREIERPAVPFITPCPHFRGQGVHLFERKN
jgi:hypothetical protein